MFELGRSGRRGYSTHASTNMVILDADIKRLARWRYIEAAGGKAPSFAVCWRYCTNESYQELNLVIKTLLLYYGLPKGL
jgi:hypothetical protein